MMKQTYKLTIEIDDLSGSDGEDIELAVEEALAYLPDDLIARIVECEAEDGYEREDY